MTAVKLVVLKSRSHSGTSGFCAQPRLFWTGALAQDVDFSGENEGLMTHGWFLKHV